jgi:plastocyanin
MTLDLAGRWWGRLVLLAAAALLVFSFACGGDDDDDGDDGGATATTAPDGGDDDDGDDDDGGGGGEETFDVTMTDNLFEPAEFTVAPGTTVTFNLTNEGAAIHNMRIAGADGDYNSDDDAVSDPDLVSAGDTATVEWTAPDEAGEIDFQCDLHPTDMLGTITVE